MGNRSTTWWTPDIWDGLSFLPRVSNGRLSRVTHPPWKSLSLSLEPNPALLELRRRRRREEEWEEEERQGKDERKRPNKKQRQGHAERWTPEVAIENLIVEPTKNSIRMCCQKMDIGIFIWKPTRKTEKKTAKAIIISTIGKTRWGSYNRETLILKPSNNRIQSRL